MLDIMRKNNIFNYNKFLKPICKLLTKHKYRGLIGWDESFEKENYRHPDQHAFYYKCMICGEVYHNNHPKQEEINFIKRCGK